MKICVFADVHGNLMQFEKLVKSDDFQTADMRICLGDMVGMGPYQKECMDLLSQYEYTMLLGNHEARMTGLINDLNPEYDIDFFNQFKLYREELTNYLPLFNKLPKDITLEIGGKRIYFCHYGWNGDDMANKDNNLCNKSLKEQFGIKDGEYDYVIYGHIHSPSKVLDGKVTFIDVGSLGLKSPSNYLMIYGDNTNISIERKTIEFDKEQFLSDCKRLNYPKWHQICNLSFDNSIEKRNGKVLVTGGAGYIGANVAQKLLETDYKVVVIDNFSNSYPDGIDRLKKKFGNHISVYQFDLLDTQKLEKVFEEEDIRNVVHLASKKYVPESFEKKEEYYKNNVILTDILLKTMTKYEVKNLVFSSSITVYGKTDKANVDETQTCNPLSPYAKQKLECEALIKDWQKKTNSSAVILRLSNPVGANTAFMLGDNPKTKSYMGVLPYIVCNANNRLTFNGGDHPTKDGTTIRDYIHVEDVSMAFKFALEKVDNKFSIYNIGSSGDGYSVLDILKECEKALNKKIDYSFGPRRDGDTSIFISNNSKAQKEISLSITKNLTDMVSSHMEFTNRKS